MKQYDMTKQSDYALVTQELMLIDYTVKAREDLSEEEIETFLDHRLTKMVNLGWITSEDAACVLSTYNSRSEMGMAHSETWMDDLSATIIGNFSRMYKEWQDLRLKVAKRYYFEVEKEGEYIHRTWGWLVNDKYMLPREVEFLFDGYAIIHVVDYSKKTSDQPYALGGRHGCDGEIVGIFLTKKKMIPDFCNSSYQVMRDGIGGIHYEIVISKEQFTEMKRLLDEIGDAKLPEEDIQKFKLYDEGGED